MDLHHLLLAGLPAHSGLPRITDVRGASLHVSKVPIPEVDPRKRAPGQKSAMAEAFRIIRLLSISALLHRTNSISLSRHSFVKKDSSGL